MTTRPQPAPRSATAPTPAQRQAARLRWFLVAHVLAVLAIYVTALVVGGGLASTPFPSSQTYPIARPAARVTAASMRTPAAASHGPRDALVLPAAAPDLAPPWAQDSRAAARID